MAIGFLALLLIDVLLFVATSLLMPKPKLQGVSPTMPNRPTSKEGVPIPVVWGTILLPANVTHFSDVAADEQTEKVQTGLFSSHRVTVGYSYSALMQCVLCHGPLLEFLDVVWQDILGLNDTKETTTNMNVGGAYTPVTVLSDFLSPSLPATPPGSFDLSTTFLIGAPELFGGFKHGGGAEGFMTLYWGGMAQVPDPALAYSTGIAEADFPAYRGIAHLVFGLKALVPTTHIQPFNFGEFGTIPPVAFLVRRNPSNLGLGTGVTNIGGGANLAEMIYEALINTIWGLGVPAGEITTATFIACANTLAAEGFGVSLALSSAETGDEIITELLRYADGQVQQNPVTGQIEMSLNRADYDPATLLLLDDTNATSEVTRPSWTALVNQVRVMYTGKRGTKYTQVPTQPVDDIAAQREFGVVHALTIPYLGVTDPVVANRLAVRDLRRGATPLKRARITTNRIAAGLMIGKPFKLTNAAAGINAHVFRVVSINYGTRTDGKIVIDALEDIFNLDSPYYNIPIDPPAAWTGVGPSGPVKVTVTPTNDETTGYLELEFIGGNGQVTAVEFQEASGDATPSAWHENVTADKFATEVDLDEKHPSWIAWRILGNLKDGTIGAMADGKVDYPIATRPARPVLTYIVHFTQFADLVIDFDQDAVAYRYLISYDHIPTIDELILETPIDIPPGDERVTIVNAADLTGSIARVAYASVVAEDSAGNLSPIASITMTAINESQYTTPTPIIGPVEAEDSSRDGLFMGQIHVRLTFEINTAAIEIYATGRPGDVPSTGQMPSRTNSQLAGRYERQEGTTASADDWETEAVLSTNTSYRKTLLVQSIGPTGLRGEPTIIEALCQDVGTPPSAAPISLVVSMSTADGKAIATLDWDNNGDVLSFTRIWRNGIVIVPRADPGTATYVDEGLTPGLGYQYLIQHIRNGQTTEFAGGVGTISDSPTLLAPSFIDGTPIGAGYDSPVDFPPPNGLCRVRVLNPDPLAYTRVYVNAAPTDTGGFTSVAYMNPGDIEVIINAADCPGSPTDQTRWFYLVAERPLYTSSPDSAHGSGNFGYPA